MSATAFKGGNLADQIVKAFDFSLFDENVCRRFLLPIVRPNMVCSGCGVAYKEHEEERTLSGRDVVCGACGRKTSPRSGTVLEGVHAGYREILLIVVMSHWCVSPQEIARRTGLSDDTVRRLKKRLG